jgi:membrane-associated phospholipid phosphatase
MNLFALFGLIVGGAAYLFANRVQLSPAVFLPLLWIDRAIPFLPATGWIYAGQYLFLAWAFLCFDNLARGSRFIYACVFIQTLAVGIFFIFPISYPRELFAIPPETYSFNYELVVFWRKLDAPYNCLPSLHVSISLLCLSAFETGKLSRFYMTSIVAVLLSVSTLTFKQHYFADVVAGVFLAWFSYWLFFCWKGLS